MRIRYALITAIVAVALAWSPPDAAAQSELIVEWEASPGSGEVVKNALRDAIANDAGRPADRVYVLRRGGFYWLEDPVSWEGFHLRLRGQTADEARPEDNVCGAAFNEDCGYAIIQRVARADQSLTGNMLSNSGSGSHLTAQNIWFMGKADTGARTAYEQIALNASDSRFVFDHVVFDQSDWHLLGPNASNCDMFVTNSSFRNLWGPTQQWEGLGVRFEVGADSVVFENNTFLNIGFTPFQSEGAPMRYFLANHNTFVNIGRSFQAGNMWMEAYVTNNVFVNPFFHGEGRIDYDNPDRVDPYTGFFSIGALPALYGTNFDREIVLANNSYWRDPAFAAYYADTIRAQPIVNDTTMGWFDQFSNMVFQDNVIDVDPGLAVYPDNIDGMIGNITDLRAGTTPARGYDWGVDEDCDVCSVWPLPEDFSYSNVPLQTAATDGLPLGNLNYWPTAKDTYDANRDAYVGAIEEMATGIEITPISLVEGEDGVLSGDASVFVVPGFTHFFMQGNGYIEWEFELASDMTIGLDVHTDMRSETQRGQRIKIDGGNSLLNNTGFGEYYFCTLAIAGCAVPLPNNEWTTVEIRATNLINGTDALLNLTAGTHTVRIEPSWGWQGFSGIDITDNAGTVLSSFVATDADYQGVQAICDDSDYCPQFFKAATLNPGGQVEFNFDAPWNGQYLLRIFYQTPSGAAVGEMLIDDVTEGTGDLTDAIEGSDLFTGEFELTEGVHKIALRSESGIANIDYVQLLALGTGVGTERDELPEGFALDQNYPNPFNPVTTIRYTLGSASRVNLRVYDVLGRLVRTLVQDAMPAGTFEVQWDGRTAAGAQVASGIYFYRLETDRGQQVRNMVLVK
jgi:hypothetical protein